MKKKLAQIQSAPLYIVAGVVVLTVVVLVSCKKQDMEILNAAPSIENATTTTTRSNQQTNASLKSLLSKVSPKVRMEFLQSICFVNRKISSFKFNNVKRSLTKVDYKFLFSSIGWAAVDEADHEGYCCSGKGECKACLDHICNPEFCSDGTEGIKVSDMRGSVPEADIQRYLLSLDFVNGNTISGDLTTISKYLGKSQLSQLPGIR